MIGRSVDTQELIETLGLDTACDLRNEVLRSVLDRAAAGARLPLDIRFWVEDGLLEVYAMDDEIEAATGVGGTLLMEVRVGDRFARCVVCGQHNRHDPRPWCTRQCRNLFRGEAYARCPDLPAEEALSAGLAWMVRDRNTRLGWYQPLNRFVAEKLYHRR